MAKNITESELELAKCMNHCKKNDRYKLHRPKHEMRCAKNGHSMTLKTLFRVTASIRNILCAVIIVDKSIEKGERRTNPMACWHKQNSNPEISRRN